MPNENLDKAIEEIKHEAAKEGSTEAIRQISNQQYLSRNSLEHELRTIKEEITAAQAAVVIASIIASVLLPFFCWLFGVGTKH